MKRFKAGIAGSRIPLNSRPKYSILKKAAVGLAALVFSAGVAFGSGNNPTMSVESYNQHYDGIGSVFTYSVTNTTENGTQLDVLDLFRIDNFDTSGVLGYNLGDAGIEEWNPDSFVLDTYIQPGETETFTFYISPEFTSVGEGIADGMSREGYNVTGEWDFNEVYVPVPMKAPVVGDVDGDGVVGISDFMIVVSHWLESSADYSDGDISGDGNVGMEDFAILAGNWMDGVE